MKPHIPLCSALLVMLGSSACSMAESLPTQRETFDYGWKFARFGKMPDGSHRDEPGTLPGMLRASSEESGNPAAKAFDDNPSTRWCAKNGAKDQWLTVDMGRKVSIASLGIQWEKEGEHTYAVQVSDNGSTWRDVVKQTTTREGTDTLKLGTSARHLKIKADGGPAGWASIRELIVKDPQGRQLRPEPPAGEAKVPPAQAVGFKDDSWRSVDLPHDWAIEGPFRMEIENETGKLPWEGIGWYRKTFTVPAGAAGRQLYLDFDGAMAQPKVYVNGEFAGEWKYGYNSFRIDLTPFVKPGKENTVAVRLENLPASTRWYPGAGLYRHVWLVDAPRTHIAQWGVYVTTPEISAAKATVAVQTTVDNNSDSPAKLTIREEVLDGQKVVAKVERPVEVAAGSSATAPAKLDVTAPRIWDLARPNLYTLRTTILAGSEVVDTRLTTFGIREIKWDAEKGFLLNGRKVVLNGVCNHHDLGPLGAAVHTRAIERQIEILKEMGCNSIRTSHNPPAPELLEACDRMGILVLDELFDIWKMQKYGKVNGYNTFWDAWHEKDVRNYMLRDRNHPCIIAWSTGNEIDELSTPSMHWVGRRLYDLIKTYDTTRPVTAGSNRPDASKNGFQDNVDVFGLNYWTGSYGSVAKNLPNMPIYASETASTVSTRGEYFFDDNRKEGPVDWNQGKGFYLYQVSSYDLYAPGWANRPDITFEGLDKHPRYAGEYVWTGFDYIGEPTPYNQDASNALNVPEGPNRKKIMEELTRLGSKAPSRSSYFGILDLCGFKKDRFYIYQGRWRPDLPMAHILPHWNWPERVGKVTPVHVYTSGDEAELFLNGKSLGKRKIGKPHNYRLVWDDVKYEPGKLEVVVTKDGKSWAKAKVETTGKEAMLDAVADRKRIAGDGRDLSYVTVRVCDAQGREVPRTRTPLRIKVSGPIEIVGVGNGDPIDHTTMKPQDPTGVDYKAFNGLAQVIVRSKRNSSGKAEISIQAPRGMTGDKVAIEVVPVEAPAK